MKVSPDAFTGACFGLILGFGIFLIFFSGNVGVDLYTCYYNVQTPVYDDDAGLVCNEGKSGNPCFNAVKSVNQSGLVSYGDVKPYLVDREDKLLNISLNEVIQLR